MPQLSLSRSVMKLIYQKMLHEEAERLTHINISEYIEDALIDYFNINLIEIKKNSFATSIFTMFKVNIINDYNIAENKLESEQDEIESEQDEIEFDKYVYAYLNPTEKMDNPIIITIDDLQFLFEYQPFYIGKGSDRRSQTHLRCYEHNQTKNKIIQTLQNDGHEPIIVILKNKLLNLEAHRLENAIIYELNKYTTLSNKLGGKFKVNYKQDNIKRTLEYNKRDLLLKILNSTSSLKQCSIKLGISERTVYRLKNRFNITKINNEYIFKTVT